MNQGPSVSRPPAAACTCRSRTLTRLRARQPGIAAAFMAAMFSLAMAGGATAAKRSAAGPIAAQRPASARAVAEAEIGRIARASGGEVGVLARNLETGATLSLNDGVSFPMASTFKVPVAVRLLTQVDRGELRLDSMITVRPGDLHPGSGTLTDLFSHFVERPSM